MRGSMRGLSLRERGGKTGSQRRLPEKGATRFAHEYRHASKRG